MDKNVEILNIWEIKDWKVIQQRYKCFSKYYKNTSVIFTEFK